MGLPRDRGPSFSEMIDALPPKAEAVTVVRQSCEAERVRGRRAAAAQAESACSDFYGAEFTNDAGARLLVVHEDC